MECPICRDSQLKERTLKGRGMRLDHCPGCGGLWFDAGELCELLGNKAVKPFAIPNFAQRNQDRPCPKCHESLFEFCYPGTVSLVDACPGCNGVWLDNDEWKEISKARCEKNMMTCPKCNTVQVKADTCSACAIVIAKYLSRGDQQVNEPLAKVVEEAPESEKSYADDVPGMKGGLLRFIDRSISALTDY